MGCARSRRCGASSGAIRARIADIEGSADGGLLPTARRARDQISLAHALHFVASTALGSLQNGQVLTACAGSSLMNILEICQTTNAITTNAMSALTKAPQRI